ncbi:MAG: molybdate ABC transporter substrate-binding protein [Terriglobales bacterium]
MGRATIPLCATPLPSMSTIARTFRVVILVLAVSLAVGAQTLTVAAAADLGPALRQLAVDFQERTGIKVALVLGSSGSLATQIEHGAPYDVFLSADMAFPHRLVNEGHGAGEVRLYAMGKLVLWVLNSSGIDVRALGFKTLTAPGVRKIAIANPAHAPYGRAAVAALRGANLYEPLKSRLVLGETVSQAAEFVSSGNAQVGIVPLSLALASELAQKGRWWKIPANTYPPIEQGGIVLKKSTNAAAETFMRYLTSSAAAAVLRRSGFNVPQEPR